MNPKISIITISYNNCDGLEKTIKSVISQNLNDFEYIVIDGDSKDGSKDIIEKYADKISYWVSEPDKGIYNAMNKGIKAANGEYLLFLNSGDELYNQHVISDVFNEIFDQDIISGNLFHIDDTNSDILISPENVDYKHLIYNTIWHPCSFIRRDKFELIGLYDENLKIVSDWKWFLLAIAKYNCSYKKINHVIAKFYADGISSNEENKELIKFEREKSLNEEFPLLLNLFDEYERYFFNYHLVKKKYNLLLQSRIIIFLKKLGFYKYFEKHKID